MNKYRACAFCMMVIIIFILGGCRYRISHDEVEVPPPETPSIAHIQEPPEEITEQPEPPDYMPDDITLPEPEITQTDTQDEPPTDYVSAPYVEATEDNFSPLIMELEQEDARRYGTEEIDGFENDETPIGTEADEYTEPEHIVTVEQPKDIEGEAVIGTEGGIVGLVATYSTILRQGVNSIFPCQLLNIYAETTDELVTVLRGSDLYQLMLDSGGLNVSSRLTASNLTVTADWVVRRNPDIIVKFVDGTVLGSGIASTHTASDVAAGMIARPDWGAMEAVRNNRIILLSMQMLDIEASRLAAQLLIAQMMYPELFEGIDINGTIAELMSETEGFYFYRLVN